MADEGTELREYLADRDVPCPGCGYNLRGLTGAVCPECGRAMSFRVEAARRVADRRFLGGVCGTLVGVVGWVIVIVANASDPLWPIALWVPGAMLGATMVLTVVWTGALRQLGRKSKTWAFANATVAWLMAALCFLLLLLFLVAQMGNR